MQFRTRWRMLAGACLISVQAFGGGTEDFFRAIRANELNTLRKLAASKEAVNAGDGHRTTPLIYAALYGNADSVRLLLAAGADVNARNDQELTALIAGACNPAIARLLVDRGADVNAQSKKGRTPLLVAAGCPGSLATMRLLLEKGARVDLADVTKTTPLMAAAAQTTHENVELLVARGADVNARDEAGLTPLMATTGLNDLAATRLLLSKGAQVNVANTSGGKVRHGEIALKKLTPLQLAAPYASPDLVRALLAAGARVNDRDVRGMTALMLAVSSETQNPEVAKALLEAGADVQIKDNDGESALDWALKYAHPEVMRRLKDTGAPSRAVTKAPVRQSEPLKPRDAVGQAVRLLSRSAGEFFQQSGCVACHHQVMATRAWAAAYHAGAFSDAAPGKQYTAGLLAARPVIEPAAVQMMGPPGDIDTILYLMVGAAEAGAPSSPLSDATMHFIANRQMPDGRWTISYGGVSRAPIEESDITRTMLAIRMLKSYSWPARQSEFDQRIARARKWMEGAQTRTSYEMAEKLLGLKWAGSTEGQLKRAAEDLLGAQHADGGWSQNAHLGSDAYATGLALYALNETGQMPPGAPAYGKGVEYLLRTQLEDGSWYVRSRAPKFQPYFQSGFPHDHDQWISNAATAMAVMALAPAAAAQLTAGR